MPRSNLQPGCIGEMLISEGASLVSLTPSDTYIRLDASDGFIAGVLRGVTYNDGILTTPIAGQYDFVGTISSKTATAIRLYEFAAFITTDESGKTRSERFFSSNDTGAQALSAILTLAAGDTVDIRARCLGNTGDVTPIHINLKIHEI